MTALSVSTLGGKVFCPDLYLPSCSKFNHIPFSRIFPDESKEIDLEKAVFGLHVAKKAIEAYLSHNYTKFDPQTTTNCCHGISLLVRRLLREIGSFDLRGVMHDLSDNIDRLESTSKEVIIEYSLPEPAVILTQLYLLTYVKEKDASKGGWATIPTKLKEIAPISSKFCSKLVKKLQFHFSNHVAESYKRLLDETKLDYLINGIAVRVWGKYVQEEMIRIDGRGRKYAACLYSMQVSLAYLIQHKAMLALVCDLKSEAGIFKDRCIQILKGDGISNFLPITDISPETDDEPILIFGGCTYSDLLNKKLLEVQLNPWIYNFPSLVLACDVFYPQFPAVSGDKEFKSHSIEPEEENIRQIIDLHKQVVGVSACDPSLFCLSHVYTASMNQIRAFKSGEQDIIPESHIPDNKRFKEVAEIP